MIESKKDKRQKVRYKIRKRISGSNDTPRLAVFRSNKEIYAQIVDDSNSKTIVAASSKDKDLKLKTTNKIEVSKIVGDSIGKKAVKAGIKEVSFDRNGYLYHGRVKSLADGAREAGLNF